MLFLLLGVLCVVGEVQCLLKLMEVMYVWCLVLGGREEPS